MAAAERVFSRQGFAATRLSDIAKEANVTRGAIYHHFKNKMDLFHALHEERIDPYFDLVERIIKSDISPKAKIKKVFTEFLQNAHRDINFISRQRFDIFQDIEMASSERIRSYIRKRGFAFYEHLASIIEQGQASGEIRNDVKPDIVALNLVAYMKGLVSIFLMEGLVNTGIDMNGDELVETMLKGL